MKLPQLSRSPRHTTEKEDDSLVITIRSRRSIGTLLAGTLLLLLWAYMSTLLLTLWSVMLMAAKETAGTEVPGIFILIVCIISMFLLYMLLHGIYAIYVFLREIAGKEIIVVNRSQLAITKQLFAWKRGRELPKENLERLIIRNTSYSFFKRPLDKQYKDAFEMNYDGKTYRFGYYVREDEAKEILSAIRAFISLAQ